MGNFLSSLFGSSQTTQYQPPEELRSAVTDLLKRAGAQSQQPYPQYTPAVAAQYANYVPGMVAPMTPNQAQAGQSIAGLQGYTAPNFAAATGLAAAAANPIQLQQFSPQSVGQYMSPFLSNVLGSTIANINQTNAQQQQQVLGNAIQRGAFGGDRAGIAQAELARQQNLANNATIANLLNQGYTQATDLFGRQQAIDAAAQLQNRQLMSGAATNLANLGTQGQQAALQQAQAQYGFGSAEQQQQQAGLSTAYQQFLNQYAYPYQQLGWYSQLASGAAPALGASTIANAPTTSPLGIGFGGLTTLGAIANPTMQTNNPFAYTNAGASALGSAFGSLFGGFKEGGRVGFADGGVPTGDDPVSQAYNDYNALLVAGAPLPVLQAAYAKYQNAFRGAPFPTVQTQNAAAPKTQETASTTPTAGLVSGGGGGGGGGGLSDVSVRNAQYSPDYTSSNGPVGGVGGYGPYYAGGGPGATFNQPKGLSAISGLFGGVDKTTGAQTGIMGAVDALLHGNSPGTLNAVLNQENRVARDSAGNPFLRDDGTPYPNTTSGMTLQEYADKFTGGDASKVGARVSTINGAPQIDFYNMSNPFAKVLQAGGIPATQLTGEAIDADGTPVSAADMAAAINQGRGSTVTSARPQAPELQVGVNSEGGPTADLPARKEAAQGLLPGAYPIDPASAGLMAAIAKVESGGKANAVGDSGAAVGMHQLHNPAAREAATSLGLEYDPSMRADPATSQMLSQQYLNQMQNYTGTGDIRDAIAAYQMGPGAWKEAYQAGLNPARSNPYVDKVMGTGLVDPNMQVMPPGAPPTPQSRPATLDIEPSRGPSPGSAESRSNYTGDYGRPGGGGRDTSMDRANIYSEPAGPSMSDFGDRGESSGGAYSSSYSAREKRGGRIGHYAKGGYAPITMQYGLPTEDILAQYAQSFAGSGADQLPATAQALAAKGVLGSKHGGRIHKLGGGSAGAGQPVYDAMGNFTGLYEQDPEVQKAAEQAAKYPRPQNTQPVVPKMDTSSLTTTEPAPAPEKAPVVTPRKAQMAPVVPGVPGAPLGKDYYFAPPPANMSQLGALAFGARLMSPGAFGTNLANAASDYARNIMAQQSEQRATMKSQQEAAKDAALAAQTRLATAKSAVEPGIVGTRIFGYDEETGQPIYQLQESPEPGQTLVGGTQANQVLGGGTTGVVGGGQFVELNALPVNGDDTIDKKASVLREIGKRERSSYSGLSPADQNARAATYSEKIITPADERAGAAMIDQKNTNELVKAIASIPETGPLSAGKGADYAYSIAGWMQSAAQRAGIDLGLGPDASVPEVLNKIRTLRAENYTGSQRVAATWLQNLAKTVPDVGMTKEASAKITANMLLEAQQARDYANFVKAYGKASSFMGTSPNAAFNQLYADDYRKEQEAIERLMLTKFELNGKTTNPIAAALSGQISREQFNKFIRQNKDMLEGVQNLDRYIYGG